jgi:hypothetical protein
MRAGATIKRCLSAVPGFNAGIAMRKRRITDPIRRFDLSTNATRNIPPTTITAAAGEVKSCASGKLRVRTNMTAVSGSLWDRNLTKAMGDERSSRPIEELISVSTPVPEKLARLSSRFNSHHGLWEGTKLPLAGSNFK